MAFSAADDRKIQKRCMSSHDSPSLGLHPHCTEGSWYKRLVNVFEEKNRGKRKKKRRRKRERRKKNGKQKKY